MRIFAAALLLVFFAAFAFAADPGQVGTIKEVRVRGNLRIEAQTVTSPLKTHAGEVYDDAKVREDIRSIYSMGYFDDVVVEHDGQGIVTFAVLERPALRHWEMEKNTTLESSALEKEFSLKSFEILKIGDVERGTAAIRKLFADKGYYLARVTPVLTAVEDGTHMADLVYKVDPREKVKVRSINLPGSTPQEAAEIKKVLTTGEENLWTWITDGANFKTAELDQDLEYIRTYYLEKGNAQVKVGQPVNQLSADLLKMEITIPVYPGPKYDIGLISFSGDSQYTNEVLLESSKIETGKPFTMSAVRQAIRNIEDLYADDGYAFAEVVPQTNFKEDKGILDLNFAIRKGDKYKIGRIEIRGNDHSRDRVIRREIPLAEGDVYSRKSLAKAERNLRKLGYFDNVAISRTKRTESGLLDLDVEVKEQHTGTFSVGAGYSSEDKIFAVGNVTNRNLLGYGYQLSGDASVSSTRQTYSISFTNPRILDSDIYGGTDVYKMVKDYTEYTKSSLGGDVKIGAELYENWRWLLEYGYDSSNITGVCTYAKEALGLCTKAASIVVQEQAGRINTSKVSPTLIYDTRDSNWLPTEGNYSRAEVSWAGWLLGGDAAYMKYEADSRQYFPMPLEMVFMARLRGAYIHGIDGKEIPIYERFALGGLSTLRGFAWRSVGPKDKGQVDPVTGAVTRPSSGEVIGGDKYGLVNLEVLFPLIKDAKLNGIVFFDTGNAWDKGQGWFSTGLRYSAGTGIRWFSPMGPIQLEWGYNLSPKEGEHRAKWDFSIGGFF